MSIHQRTLVRNTDPNEGIGIKSQTRQMDQIGEQYVHMEQPSAVNKQLYGNSMIAKENQSKLVSLATPTGEITSQNMRINHFEVSGECQSEQVPSHTRDSSPAKVTTQTFREDNGDRIVTITQRHATASKPGRIVTTITTGIRSGCVKSKTIQEETQPLTYLTAPSSSVLKASYLEELGNEELRKQILGKITHQLGKNSKSEHAIPESQLKENITPQMDKGTYSSPNLPLNKRLHLNILEEVGTPIDKVFNPHLQQSKLYPEENRVYTSEKGGQFSLASQAQKLKFVSNNKEKSQTLHGQSAQIQNDQMVQSRIVQQSFVKSAINTPVTLNHDRCLEHNLNQNLIPEFKVGNVHEYQDSKSHQLSHLKKMAESKDIRYDSPSLPNPNTGGKITINAGQRVDKQELFRNIHQIQDKQWSIQMEPSLENQLPPNRPNTITRQMLESSQLNLPPGLNSVNPRVTELQLDSLQKSVHFGKGSSILNNNTDSQLRKREEEKLCGGQQEKIHRQVPRNYQLTNRSVEYLQNNTRNVSSNRKVKATNGSNYKFNTEIEYSFNPQDNQKVLRQIPKESAAEAHNSRNSINRKGNFHQTESNCKNIKNAIHNIDSFQIDSAKNGNRPNYNQMNTKRRIQERPGDVKEIAPGLIHQNKFSEKYLQENKTTFNSQVTINSPGRNSNYSIQTETYNLTSGQQNSHLDSIKESLAGKQIFQKKAQLHKENPERRNNIERVGSVQFDTHHNQSVSRRGTPMNSINSGMIGFESQVSNLYQSSNIAPVKNSQVLPTSGMPSKVDLVKNSFLNNMSKNNTDVNLTNNGLDIEKMENLNIIGGHAVVSPNVRQKTKISTMNRLTNESFSKKLEFQRSLKLPSEETEIIPEMVGMECTTEKKNYSGLKEKVENLDSSRIFDSYGNSPIEQTYSPKELLSTPGLNLKKSDDFPSKFELQRESNFGSGLKSKLESIEEYPCSSQYMDSSKNFSGSLGVNSKQSRSRKRVKSSRVTNKISQDVEASQSNLFSDAFIKKKGEKNPFGQSPPASQQLFEEDSSFSLERVENISLSRKLKKRKSRSKRKRSKYSIESPSQKRKHSEIQEHSDFKNDSPRPVYPTRKRIVSDIEFTNPKSKYSCRKSECNSRLKKGKIRSKSRSRSRSKSRGSNIRRSKRKKPRRKDREFGNSNDEHYSNSRGNTSRSRSTSYQLFQDKYDENRNEFQFEN